MSKRDHAPLPGFQATAASVQDMHHAIAGQTFDSLLSVPGLAVPTRIVQGLHDAIAQGVYAAVRHGGSPLPVTMSCFADDGAPLALTADGVAGLHRRVCVFIHGLACDERSWRLHADAWKGSAWEHALPAGERLHYGALLVEEMGFSTVYLRYNTGISVAANAAQLAGLLEQLVHAAPQVEELVLIGHSMGGLVARLARETALAEGAAWPARANMVICLGSPHQGAPLEPFGQMVASAMGWWNVMQMGGVATTVPAAVVVDAPLPSAAHSALPVALRLVSGSLSDESASMMGSLIGSVLGDGVVSGSSAGDAGWVGDVQRLEVAGLGHMALLNHPRVYAAVRGWLGAGD